MVKGESTLRSPFFADFWDFENGFDDNYLIDLRVVGGQIGSYYSSIV